MAKRRSLKPKLKPKLKGRGDTESATGASGASNIASGASNIASGFTETAIKKKEKLPKQIVKRHKDGSIYMGLLILSLFCVNLYFYMKDVYGKSMHKEGDLNDMSEDERKIAVKEDEALRSALEFFNNMTTAIHSAFLMANFFAYRQGIGEGHKIHDTYLLTFGVVLLNLAISFLTTLSREDQSFATKTQIFIYSTALLNLILYALRKVMSRSTPSATGASP